jgi:hypothetical protein
VITEPAALVIDVTVWTIVPYMQILTIPLYFSYLFSPIPMLPDAELHLKKSAVRSSGYLGMLA